MILQFVIASALLLVVFCVAMVIPFIRSKSTDIVDKERRNQLNHDLYDVRLKEVDADIDQGVVIDKEVMITELQHNLLDDINESQPVKSNTAKWIWVPGVIALISLSVALYWTVGAFKEVSDWEASLQRYPEIHKNLFEKPDARPNEQELKDLMLGLRSHLANEPNDAQGWVLYSRLGRVFKDKELALGAIKKALKAEPDNVEIELEFIELKMKMNDEYAQATAKSMLKKVLKKHPDNYDAWSMYGFMALQKEDFGGAIFAWKKMLGLVDENSEKASMLNSSITYARQQLASKGNTEPKQVQAKVAEPAKKEPLIEGAAYYVNVTLSEQVTYAKNSTLFIYAQSVGGPPMPIAAIKLPITEFPVKVVLSDANAMMQGVKLSDHKQFIIKARISADGTVNKTSGQWFGKSGVINAGDKAAINIEINEQS